MKRAIWVGGALTAGFFAVLFVFAAIGLSVDGDVGAAVVALVLAAGCAFLTRVTWHRSMSEPRAPTELDMASPPSAESTGLGDRVLTDVGARYSSYPPARPAPRSVPARTIEGERVFGYPHMRGQYRHSGPFAVVDLETTGLSVGNGDRVVEIAILRMDRDGQVLDEFATLVNPEGRDTGPTFVHHIKNEDVLNAPTFPDIADEVLGRLSGCVVVAHNASFEERFLGHELRLAGYGDVHFPALCTLQLARETVDAPNYKLGTLARQSGIPLLDAHAALGDVRAVAQLLPRLLDARSESFKFTRPPLSWEATGARQTPLVTRAVALRKGSEGWMASLMSRLPLTANDAHDDITQAYLDLLGDVMADGRVTGDEARELARLAGQAGLGGAQVKALNEQFLEGLRQSAFEDDVLTAAELRSLTRAASSLGAPTYFDDLTPESIREAVVVDAPGQNNEMGEGPAKRVRRCGHCRQPGHYRPRCPELVAS